MSNPNDRQVGGSHYRAGFQHWDLVAHNKLGYFEAQITKYITRWKKKNGAQDVEKSLHYLEKLIDLLDTNVLSYPEPRKIWSLDRFAEENRLDVIERRIFKLALSYTTKADLEMLKECISQLLLQAKQLQRENAVPVPESAST